MRTALLFLFAAVIVFTTSAPEPAGAFQSRSQQLRDEERRRIRDETQNPQQAPQRQPPIKKYTQITIDPQHDANIEHENVVGSINFHSFADARKAIANADAPLTITFFDNGGGSDYSFDEPLNIRQSTTLKSPSDQLGTTQLSFRDDCIRFNPEKRSAVLQIMNLNLESRNKTDACISSEQHSVILNDVRVYLNGSNSSAIRIKSGRLTAHNTVLSNETNDRTGKGLTAGKESKIILNKMTIGGFHTAIESSAENNSLEHSRLEDNIIAIRLKNQARRFEEHTAPELTVTDSIFVRNKGGIVANEGFELIRIDGEATTITGVGEESVGIQFIQQNGPGQIEADIKKVENLRPVISFNGRLNRDVVRISVKDVDENSREVRPTDWVCDNIKPLLNETIRIGDKIRNERSWKRRNGC